MKFLLVAINAKYIHSNLGVYSLKAYGEQEQGKKGGRGLQGRPGSEKKRWEIEVAEYTINNQAGRLLEDIYQRKPDVVGFSCYIWNMAYVRELIHDLPKVLPETDIWLGGPEVSFDALCLLGQEPEVLGIMKGEGEETFAGLLSCYQALGCAVKGALAEAGAGQWESPAAKGVIGERAGLEGKAGTPATGVARHGIREAWTAYWNQLETLAGVVFRRADGAVAETGARLGMDINRIPFPYKDMEGFSHRIIYYESSRGCPFCCSYCLSSVDKAVRFRDLGLVEQELDFFLEKEVPQVKFIDRTFNCKKSHAMAVWRHILNHDNGITNFHFEIAADLLDEEEMELLGKMRPGLVQLEIGVQSTNPDTIREIHRKMDLEKVGRAVARVNAGHNIHQHLDLIAGLPQEGYESFRRSFNQVYAMRPAQLQLGFLKVLKGSFMHQAAKEYGLRYRETPPYEVLSTAWLPYGDVIRLKAVEEMVEVYYNSGQFTLTMDILSKETDDAFGLYERLAGYYGKKGLAGLNHSRLARYETLHRFLEEEWFEEGLAGAGAQKHTLAQLEDALICDLYLRENSRGRPSFALDQKPYRDKVRRLASKYEEAGRLVHVEMLRSGELARFDYRERDLLTGNVSMHIFPAGAIGAT